MLTPEEVDEFLERGDKRASSYERLHPSRLALCFTREERKYLVRDFRDDDVRSLCVETCLTESPPSLMARSNNKRKHTATQGTTTLLFVLLLFALSMGCVHTKLIKQRIWETQPSTPEVQILSFLWMGKDSPFYK